LPGAYFVTLVSKDRQPIFGQVIGEEIMLSPIGQIVSQEWRRTPDMRPNVSLEEFIVMPDHFHAILFIHEQSSATSKSLDGNSLGAHRSAPQQGLRRQPNSLSSIMAGFKSKASQRAGRTLWQRNYYDRIIRDEAELNRIREYILYNPLLLSQQEGQ